MEGRQHHSKEVERETPPERRRRSSTHSKKGREGQPPLQSTWSGSHRGERRKAMMELGACVSLLVKCHPFAPVRVGRLSQVIVEETTSRVRPVGPWSANIMVSNAAAHWTSTTSLLELVAFLDAGMNSKMPNKPWILLMDCASVHISKEYRAAMHKLFLA